MSRSGSLFFEPVRIVSACFISLPAFSGYVSGRRGPSLLRCHFCGNQLSLAQALELHEGEGYFYVCEACAMSLDPLRLKETSCYRCASEGKRNRSVAACDMCGKPVCSSHHVDMHHSESEPIPQRMSRYQPALAMGSGKRRVLCDVCAAAMDEDEE